MKIAEIHRLTPFPAPYYGKMDMFSKSWWHSWTDTKSPHRSWTYFDPKNWRLYGKTRSPGWGLIHELGHMVDHDRGTFIPQSSFGPKAPVAETRAIWWENQVRPWNDQRQWDDHGREFR